MNDIKKHVNKNVLKFLAVIILYVSIAAKIGGNALNSIISPEKITVMIFVMFVGIVTVF